MQKDIMKQEKDSFPIKLNIWLNIHKIYIYIYAWSVILMLYSAPKVQLKTKNLGFHNEHGIIYKSKSIH